MSFGPFRREKSRTMLEGPSSGLRLPTYSRVFPPAATRAGGSHADSDGSGFVADYSGATASDLHGLPFAPQQTTTFERSDCV